MSKTRTNLTTDKEQYTRSNAATAWPLTLVETGRNLNIRLTEHKRATKNGDVNNHIAEHHLHTNHKIDWDSAECVTYSTDYYKRLALESWFTNLEQTPLNRCQQLPAAYKQLVNRTDKHKTVLVDNLTNTTTRNYTNNTRIETHQPLT